MLAEGGCYSCNIDPREETLHILRGIKSRKGFIMKDFTFMNNIGNRILVFPSKIFDVDCHGKAKSFGSVFF